MDGPMSVSDSSKRTVHLDIEEDEMNGLEMGKEISITVKGKVRSISAPYEYENEDGETKKEPYGSVSLRVSAVEIGGKENVFSKIAEEEDDE